MNDIFETSDEVLRALREEAYKKYLKLRRANKFFDEAHRLREFCNRVDFELKRRHPMPPSRT